MNCLVDIFDSKILNRIKCMRNFFFTPQLIYICIYVFVYTYILYALLCMHVYPFKTSRSKSNSIQFMLHPSQRKSLNYTNDGHTQTLTIYYCNLVYFRVTIFLKTFAYQPPSNHPPSTMSRASCANLTISNTFVQLVMIMEESIAVQCIYAVCVQYIYLQTHHILLVCKTDQFQKLNWLRDRHLRVAVHLISST